MILAALLATNLFTLTPAVLDAVADRIYAVEGGAKARIPYGILAVKVKDEADARRVCKRTIQRTFGMWVAAGHKEPFVDFLADRYCPPKSDATGNRNWKRNMRKLLTKRKYALNARGSV